MTQPLVTAVMITGKSPTRRPWCRMSLKAFLAQSWRRKELLIINDGEQSWADLWRDQPGNTICEILVPHDQPRTLGALRNLALEQAQGDWIIQWDDDDWSAPWRMALQMEHRQPDRPVTLRRQIRYSTTRDTAFVFAETGRYGIAGTILHPRTALRYPSRSIGEDAAFIKSWPQPPVVLEQAPPQTYVRIFHGGNTWHERHIMKHWAGQSDRWELEEPIRLDLERILKYLPQSALRARRQRFSGPGSPSASGPASPCAPDNSASATTAPSTAQAASRPVEV